MKQKFSFHIHSIISCSSSVFFCISAQACFTQQCIATLCLFREWIGFERIKWVSDSTVCLIRFYWIGRFKRIVWYEWVSKLFIKTGICCHLLAVLLSYLFIASTKTHSAKYCLIINTDQISCPRRKTKHRNNSSFNEAEFALNRSLFKIRPIL